jgi:L-amino acid N-acyltransferase YncA
VTRIRRATVEDAEAIARIYAPYVTDTAISFETEAVSAAQIAERVQSFDVLYPWFVAEDGAGDTVVGYAYATQFRTRPAYRFAAETSIYLEPSAQGRGVGTLLYRALLDKLFGQGFIQAIAGITLPNEASVRLHERVGFKLVGVYKDIGYKLGRWHDVGRYQCQLAEPRVPPAEPIPATSAGG